MHACHGCPERVTVRRAKKKRRGHRRSSSLPEGLVAFGDFSLSGGYSTAQAMVAFFSSLDVLIMAMQVGSLQTLNRVLAFAEAVH